MNESNIIIAFGPVVRTIDQYNEAPGFDSRRSKSQTFSSQFQARGIMNKDFIYLKFITGS